MNADVQFTYTLCSVPDPYEMVPPTVRLGLPTPITQSRQLVFFSYMILDPVKLTMVSTMTVLCLVNFIPKHNHIRNSPSTSGPHKIVAISGCKMCSVQLQMSPWSSQFPWYSKV